MDETWGTPESGLVVAASGDRDAVVLRLAGELDLAGTALLADALAVVTLPPPAELALDLESLTFIDSAGLAGLVRALRACSDRGVSFRITSMSPPVARVVEVAGLADTLGLA